jgi:hypothetical protein
MALTWDARNVPEAERNHPLFQSAIWNSMAIGIGVLDELSLPEAVVRTQIKEGLNGAWQYDNEGNPIYLWKELWRFVGLRTNVSYEPKAKWLRWHYDLAVKESRETVEYERRERETRAVETFDEELTPA